MKGGQVAQPDRSESSVTDLRKLKLYIKNKNQGVSVTSLELNAIK